MKLIIVLILLVAIVSCKKEPADDSKLTLLEIFNKSVGEDRDDDSLPHSIDRECVKQKIKLSANGEKILTVYFGVKLVEFSMMACDKTTNGHTRTKFEMSTEEFSKIDDDAATKIFCINRKLQELNGAEKEVNEKCSNVDKVIELVISRNQGQAVLTESLGVKECINVADDRFYSELLEAILKKFESSDNNEAFINGREKFVKNVMKYLNKFVECFADKLSE